jgi:hypothetical protein
MRSALFVAATAFLLSWSGLAQVPSIVESRTREAGPHSWKRVLQNQNTSSLVAYTVGCKPKHGTTALGDALLYGGPYVGSGRSIEADVNNPSRDSCNVGVRAAIFSDGHVEGDPDFVGELFAKRRGAYQALGETIQLLASVYTQHVPIAYVIDRIKRKSNGGKTQEENEGYSYALFRVKRILTQPGVRYGLPRGDRGEQQQLPAVEDVMKENGVSRDEAGIILLNMRLEEWKSLLESRLEPPR